VSRTIFVTGTDTGVGKTLVCCALLHQARGGGLRVCGYKPVASGAEPTPQGLRNDDALRLMQASGSASADYDLFNTYCYAPPIAPHLAARRAAQRIDTAALDRAHAVLAAHHEGVVVEGAGGWEVPLNENETFADWVAGRRWPVLLVVGLRLGCLNHALLSAQAIARRTHLLGWIANHLPPVPEEAADLIEDLRARLPAPLLGVIPCGADAPAAASCVRHAVWAS
jgi:dethiobiotin synthetase